MYQGDIADALLLRVLPPEMKSNLGGALLTALREYVQEVVRQEVVSTLAKQGHLLQTMVRFQVSSQIKGAGVWDEWKEWLLEQVGESVEEAARSAGYDAGYEAGSECNSAVDRDDVVEIADDQAEAAIRDMDRVDLAGEIAKHLDTDDLDDDFMDDLLVALDDARERKLEKEKADAADENKTERNVLDRVLRRDDQECSRHQSGRAWTRCPHGLDPAARPELP